MAAHYESGQWWMAVACAAAAELAGCQRFVSPDGRRIEEVDLC